MSVLFWNVDGASEACLIRFPREAIVLSVRKRLMLTAEVFRAAVAQKIEPAMDLGPATRMLAFVQDVVASLAESVVQIVTCVAHQ